MVLWCVACIGLVVYFARGCEFVFIACWFDVVSVVCLVACLMVLTW